MIMVNTTLRNPTTSIPLKLKAMMATIANAFKAHTTPSGRVEPRRVETNFST
jgi:hypothetical protein